MAENNQFDAEFKVVEPTKPIQNELVDAYYSSGAYEKMSFLEYVAIQYGVLEFDDDAKITKTINSRRPR